MSDKKDAVSKEDSTDSLCTLFATEHKQRRADDKIKYATQNRNKDIICVVENPSQVVNIGTVIRNVNALGACKLYLITDEKKYSSWDVLKRDKVIHKTSVGTVGNTYIKIFPTTQSCLDHLRKKRVTNIMTSPHIKGKNNIQLSLEAKWPQRRLAVWFGNESVGLSELAIANADICLQVPMMGMVESLNLACCTSIVLFQIISSRRG